MVVKTPHFQCRAMGSIPGQVTEISHALQCEEKNKQPTTMYYLKISNITRGRRQWCPFPVLLPGKSLVGCSPRGREASDTTERLHFHFSFSCIGEGNGNLLQYSCLENPREGPGGLLSMGSHRVRHDWSNLAAAAAAAVPTSCHLNKHTRIRARASEFFF